MLISCGEDPADTQQQQNFQDTDTSCTVVEESDGTYTIMCPDGTTVNVDNLDSENGEFPGFEDTVYYGDFEILSDFDAWRARNFEEIYGDLTIKVPEVEMSNLKTVHGNLDIVGEHVVDVDLTSLKSVYAVSINFTSIESLNTIGNSNLNVDMNVLINNNVNINACDVVNWIESIASVGGDVSSYYESCQG